MATVSTRIGWGRISATTLAAAVFNLLLAVGLYLAGHWFVSCVALGFTVLSLFFTFVHAGRVIETDTDDDPRRKIGDPIDD